jgi:hypothetical protein
MITFILNITNPWSDRFKNLKHWSGRTPFKHKYWEFEILKDSCLLTCEFYIKQKQDHAGFSFELGLIGYSIHFQFYDNRHWDYTNERWETYDEVA